MRVPTQGVYHNVRVLRKGVALSLGGICEDPGENLRSSGVFSLLEGEISCFD